MSKVQTPTRVLFICDGNADTAQMAEGLLKSLADPRFEIYSAGINSRPISNSAMQVMREINIDIAGHPAMDLNDYEELQFHHVITLCEQADNSCLNFPRDGHVTHWQLADPSAVQGTDEQVLEAYRQARDALAVRVVAWLESV